MFPIEPELIIIPAGSFLFGISEEQITALTSASHGVKQRDFEHERPLRTLTLPTYAIGKFEVTIGQYRAFIEAGGYTDPLYWTQAGWYWRKQNHIDAPRDWENPTYLCWGSEDFPIVGVSWYEAFAYCRWLRFTTGHVYRLPTEAEWEKAARGTDGRLFPWGNMFSLSNANTYSGSGRAVRNVGTTPADQSPYGVLDMGGNVSEWCLSRWSAVYQHPEDQEVIGEDARVMRGSSWDDSALDARCMFRCDLPPGHRFDTLGFRCACEIHRLTLS